MKIIFEEEQQVSQEILDTMEKAAACALNFEGIDAENIEISVTFVDENEIRELNAHYRDVDSVTDVLSFPQFDDPEEYPEEGEICIGDVVICEAQAARQAKEFGHSYEREIIYLFTHSILHLLGYDHMEEAEKQVMRAREEEIMEKLGIRRES